MKIDGLSITYLTANAAYMVCWFGQRIAGPMSYADTTRFIATHYPEYSWKELS